jgi:glycosyltransferase involved in cell wall biosynthesis
MIKNFEALAAGCVLCTYRLPYEFLHIGFKDMENAVLYSTPEELVQKIKFIEKNSALKASIIENGLLLAQSFTFESHAKKLYKALSDNILVDEKSKPRFLKFF